MSVLQLCRWLKETAAAHDELKRTNKGLASIRSNVKQLVSIGQQQLFEVSTESELRGWLYHIAGQDSLDMWQHLLNVWGQALPADQEIGGLLQAHVESIHLGSLSCSYMKVPALSCL